MASPDALKASDWAEMHRSSGFIASPDAQKASDWTEMHRSSRIMASPDAFTYIRIKKVGYKVNVRWHKDKNC